MCREFVIGMQIVGEKDVRSFIIYDFVHGDGN